jgi:ribosomal protein L3 glutamine methyltransferase
VADAIRRTAVRFRRARLYFGHGTETALDEAAWLVGHVSEIAPRALESSLARTLTAAQTRRLDALVAERLSTRQPLAYLLKEAWFAGLRFYVDERAIVPRSLTAEFILERFAPWVEPGKVRRILDLCTGSGCMAIALARAFPKARVEAVDISDEALAVARINVRRHRLTKRVRLVRSDLFERLRGRRYDLIVSNPPYVAEGEMKTLPREYRREPRLALVAGRSGLDVIVRILAEAADHLTPRGILVVETGNSHARLQAAFPRVPFVWLTTSTGDDSVFLLTAAEAAAHRAAFTGDRGRAGTSARYRRQSGGRPRRA